MSGRCFGDNEVWCVVDLDLKVHEFKTKKEADQFIAEHCVMEFGPNGMRVKKKRKGVLK